MWAMLADISAQIPWIVNHNLVMIPSHDWKDVLSACFRKDVRLAESVDGDGFVLLGARTSKMSPKQMSDFIEFMYAFGASRNVKWAEPTTEEEKDVNENNSTKDL